MRKKPFDLMHALETKAATDSKFRALVDAEVAALDLEESIIALRKRHRLTQAQVADRMGVSQSAVAQFEKKGAAAKMEMRTLAKMVSAAGGTLTIGVRAAKTESRPAARKARAKTRTVA